MRFTDKKAPGKHVDVYWDHGTRRLVGISERGVHLPIGMETDVGLALAVHDADSGAHPAIISAHLAASDPHSQYLKSTDASATYLTIASAASTYLSLTGAASAYVAKANLNTRFESVGTYYHPGMECVPVALTAGTVLGINVYRAWPKVMPRTGTINTLAIDVTTVAAASNAVIAIWSDDAGKPGTVLGEGVVSLTTLGLKTVTVSVSITAGQVYWFTLLNGGANAAIIRAVAAASKISTIGYPLGATQVYDHYEVATTYASPTPAWPSSGYTGISSSTMLGNVFYKWSV